MNNNMIIADAAVSIYGEDTVARMIAEEGEIPLHTLKGWSARGPYRIKKGEHGHEVRLWKKKNKNEKVTDEKGGEEDTVKKDFYLAKAFLFTKDQVEIVE